MEDKILWQELYLNVQCQKRKKKKSSAYTKQCSVGTERFKNFQLTYQNRETGSFYSNDPGCLGGAIWYSSKEYKYETRMLDLNPGSAILQLGILYKLLPGFYYPHFIGKETISPYLKPFKFVVRVYSVKICKMFRTVPRFHETYYYLNLQENVFRILYIQIV